MSTTTSRKKSEFRTIYLFIALATVGMIALCIVSFLANIAPYSRFFTGMLEKSTSLSGKGLQQAGTGFGVTIFLLIQSLEILPGFTKNPNSAFTQKLETLANFAYLVDLGFCLYFFPPISVSLGRFIVAGSLAVVNWQNIVITIITLYSWEFTANLFRFLFVNRNN